MLSASGMLAEGPGLPGEARYRADSRSQPSSSHTCTAVTQASQSQRSSSSMDMPPERGQRLAQERRPGRVSVGVVRGQAIEKQIGRARRTRRRRRRQCRACHLPEATPGLASWPAKIPADSASRYVDRASRASTDSRCLAAVSSKAGASLPRLAANSIRARSRSTWACWPRWLARPRPWPADRVLRRRLRPAA